MASRFPSIEHIDESQPISALAPDATVLDLGLDSLSLNDPAADLLSREQATLGPDAALFATPNDSALLGGDDGDVAGTAGFESSFPSLDSPVCAPPKPTNQPMSSPRWACTA